MVMPPTQLLCLLNLNLVFVFAAELGVGLFPLETLEPETKGLLESLTFIKDSFNMVE